MADDDVMDVDGAARPAVASSDLHASAAASGTLLSAARGLAVLWEEKQRGGAPLRQAFARAGPYSALITSKYVSIRLLAGCVPSVVVSQASWGETVGSWPLPAPVDSVAKSNTANNNKRARVTLPEHWHFPAQQIAASAWSEPLHSAQSTCPFPPFFSYIIEYAAPPIAASLHLVFPDETHAAPIQAMLPSSDTEHPPRAMVWFSHLNVDGGYLASNLSRAWEWTVSLDAEPCQLGLISSGRQLELWLCFRSSSSTQPPFNTYSVKHIASTLNPFGEADAVTALEISPDRSLLFIGLQSGKFYASPLALNFDAVSRRVCIRLDLQLPSSTFTHYCAVSSIRCSKVGENMSVAIACGSQLVLYACERHRFRELSRIDVSSGSGGLITSLEWMLEKHGATLYVSVADVAVQIYVDSELQAVARHSSSPYPREDIPVRPNEAIFGTTVSPNNLLVASFHRRNVSVEERSSVLLKMAAGVQYIRRVGHQSLRDALERMVFQVSEPKSYWDLFSVLARLASKDDKVVLRLIKFTRQSFVLSPSSDRVKEEALKVCNALYAFLLKHQQPEPSDRDTFSKLIHSNRLTIRALTARRLCSSMIKGNHVKTATSTSQTSMAQYLRLATDLRDSDFSHLRIALSQAQTAPAPTCGFCAADVQRADSDPLIGTCHRGHSTSFCCFTFQALLLSDVPRVRCPYCGVSGFDLRYDRSSDWSWLLGQCSYLLCPYCGDLCR